MMNNKEYKIFVAGHNGMVGSAVVRKLRENGYNNLITASRKELDLTSQQQVQIFFETHRPEAVILAAAKVGGINANMQAPVDFLLDNLQIQNNIISQSFIYGVNKFVFLGSSCIYPKHSAQPIKEEYLLDGKLEPTNEGYALAKIAGLKLLEYYKKQHGFNSISLMPCNIYGPNDSFDLEKSHVLSALVRKFSDAKEQNLPAVSIWGSGIAKREFMHVNDLANAVIYFMQQFDSLEFINVGWGNDISIKELVDLIKNKLDYNGEINWDTSKPDGMLKKCMDVTKMKDLGFSPTINLEEGIAEMIELYKKTKIK